MKKIISIFLFFFLNSLIYASDVVDTSELLPQEREITDVFKKVAPLVVNIHNIKKVSDFYNVYDIPAGMGSGFIWDMQGHIITNFHVIKGASEVMVSSTSTKTMRAKVIGVEPKKDIAVLQLVSPDDIASLQNLSPLKIADSAQLLVGQKAIAIGNPYGLDQTMTTGIISALNRRIQGIGGVSIRDMIQTDASINPGNSGGPLLDSKGRLMGMNTLIYSASGSSSGIGFAVPSNEIKRVANQIIASGKVTQPGLGLQLLGDQVARQLGMKGAIIAEIIPGSPAEKAGLQPTYRDQYGRIHIGDAIVAIDQQSVENYDDLYNIISTKSIGQALTLNVVRNGQPLTVELTTVDISGIE